MTENIKLPRKLSEEAKPPPPRRPSHADVIENLDRWANSPGLQPPNRPKEDGLNSLPPSARAVVAEMPKLARSRRMSDWRVKIPTRALNSRPISHAQPLASLTFGR